MNYFQEANWKGHHFPRELSHVSTKNPNLFLLVSELHDINKYLGGLAPQLDVPAFHPGPPQK
jgi:hypothetical protein